MLARAFFTLMAAMLLIVTILISAQNGLDTSQMTIGKVISAASTAKTPEFTILAAALSLANPDIAAALNDPHTEWTLFAPTDAAFEAFGLTPDALLANSELLSAMLTYHIVPGRLSSSQLVQAALGLFEHDPPEWLASASELSMAVDTLHGLPLRLTLVPSAGFMVDGARMIASDIIAQNGIIHVIDAVNHLPWD